MEDGDPKNKLTPHTRPNFSRVLKSVLSRMADVGGRGKSERQYVVLTI